MPFRILVVEDEPDFRDVLVEILRLTGYEADGVDSIRGYRELPNPGRHDLIVLDRTLPDGDGLTILEAHRKHSDIPVIILSGLGRDEDRIKGLQADANYYLVKPVKTPELLAIIAHYAKRAAPKAEAAACWSINPRQWELHAPDGATVKLTNQEILFLGCFEEAEGVRISREDIITRLGHRPEVYDIRRLEAMVSRLRNKLREAGVDGFPLATIYGTGYAFNARLMILGAT